MKKNIKRILKRIRKTIIAILCIDFILDELSRYKKIVKIYKDYKIHTDEVIVYQGKIIQTQIEEMNLFRKELDDLKRTLRNK